MSTNESNDDNQELGDRQALWRATSGAPRGRRPRGQVQDMYGKNSQGRPDTKAAAQQLGVSQRTVQRWLKEGRVPDSEGGRKLTSAHGQWRDSPAGRRAQLSPARERRLRNGAQMKYTGKVKISNDSRFRSTTVELSPEEMSAILDAQLTGDDRGAHEALEDAFGNAFGGSVGLSPKGFEL